MVWLMWERHRGPPLYESLNEQSISKIRGGETYSNDKNSNLALVSFIDPQVCLVVFSKKVCSALGRPCTEYIEVQLLEFEIPDLV